MLPRRAVLALIGIGLSGLRGTGARGQAPPRVAAVYAAPADDPHNRPIHAALTAAAARGDIVYDFAEAADPAAYEQALRTFAEQGVDLIVGDATAVEAAARRVAAEHPETAFLMASHEGPSGGNFATFAASLHEAAYLTGMVAGIMTEAGRIGLVGAEDSPAAYRRMNAFMDGALEVNPRVKFGVTVAGDPAEARLAALDLIEAGADILYAGVAEAAEAAAEEGIFAIGALVDMTEAYPGTVIASALWRAEPLIDEAIRKVRNGAFDAEDYSSYGLMRQGGAALAPLNPKLVSQDAIDLVTQRQQEILEGSFEVQSSDTPPHSSM